jgi:hypothetical protein
MIDGDTDRSFDGNNHAGVAAPLKFASYSLVT